MPCSMYAVTFKNMSESNGTCFARLCELVARSTKSVKCASAFDKHGTKWVNVSHGPAIAKRTKLWFRQPRLLLQLGRVLRREAFATQRARVSTCVLRHNAADNPVETLDCDAVQIFHDLYCPHFVHRVPELTLPNSIVPGRSDIAVGPLEACHIKIPKGAYVWLEQRPALHHYNASVDSGHIRSWYIGRRVVGSVWREFCGPEQRVKYRIRAVEEYYEWSYETESEACAALVSRLDAAHGPGVVTCDPAPTPIQHQAASAPDHRIPDPKRPDSRRVGHGDPPGLWFKCVATTHDSWLERRCAECVDWMCDTNSTIRSAGDVAFAVCQIYKLWSKDEELASGQATSLANGARKRSANKRRTTVPRPERVPKRRKSVHEAFQPETDTEYAVKRISGSRHAHGNNFIEFLVEWEDYTDATWEPEVNLGGCTELVDAYLASIDNECAVRLLHAWHSDLLFDDTAWGLLHAKLS